MANPLMEKANQWHKVGFLYAVAGSSFLIVLGVLANVAGFAGLNFLFAAVTIISALYFLTKPAMVLAGFGFSALLSGLSDLSLKESLEASIKPIGLLFLFVTIVFVTLATFPIANAAMVLPLIVILAGLQLATLVKRPGYKMVVVTILMFSGCLTLYKMYVRPTKTALAAGEILKMNQENQDKQKADDIEKLREKLKHGQVLTPEEIKLVEENVAASKGDSFFEKIGAFFAAKPQAESLKEQVALAAAAPAPVADPLNHNVTLALQDQAGKIDLSNYPDWIKKLNNASIIPGVGVAGVRLGDSENTIISRLGNPDLLIPVKNLSGVIMNYAMQYKYEGIFLGFFTTADSHQSYSLRIYDDDFNKKNLIPTLANSITIGSSLDDLLRVYGKPLNIRHHYTAPASLGNREADTYYYLGIEFCVCKANNLIFWIDIR